MMKMNEETQAVYQQIWRKSDGKLSAADYPDADPVCTVPSNLEYSGLCSIL